MVLDAEIYGVIMKVFAPNRKNNSCQEMGRPSLRGCPMGISGFWILDSALIVIVRDHSPNNGEVKENRLKNIFYRKAAPVPSSGATG